MKKAIQALVFVLVLAASAVAYVSHVDGNPFPPCDPGAQCHP